MNPNIKSKFKTKFWESIEKHDILNPKLFGDDELLKPEVLDKINAIVDEFSDGLAQDDIELPIEEVILIGSNVSYNYSKDSDLDIHIIVNTDDLDYPADLYDKLYSAYRSLFNKKFDIEFYDIPVELYVETGELPRVSNGVYSVTDNCWIKHPVQQDIPDIDLDKFNDIFKVWEDKYIQTKAENTVEAVDKFIEDIYALRKASLTEGGEYSEGNLVFKEIRNLGYLDELKELKNTLKAKNLSLYDDDFEVIDYTGDSDEDEDDPILDDVLFETIDRKELETYRNKIAQISFNQPIIQPNGMFTIYNVKQDDVNNIVNRLRREPYIEAVYSTPGRFDFSDMGILRGMPAKRIYSITGRIKQN